MEILDGDTGWRYWMKILDGDTGWRYWMEILDGDRGRYWMEILDEDTGWRSISFDQKLKFTVLEFLWSYPPLSVNGHRVR